MRVAIIGAGTQGRRHVRAFRAAGATVVGIAAGSAASAHTAAQALALGAYADATAAIADTAVEAIVVASPTATHADIVVAALRAGKHVLCEVPVAHGVADARAMRQAAIASGRVLQAGLVHRFEPIWTAFVALARDGTLGRPLHLVTERLSAFQADGLSRPHHGDAIDELLAFDIHLLLWALGRPRRIAADATCRDGRIVRVTAALTCGDVTASCFATADMPRGHPFTERASLTLEHGRLEALNRFWPDRVEARLLRCPLHGSPEEVALAPIHPLVAQAGQFIAACAGGADAAYADIGHAADMLEIAQAVRDALPASLAQRDAGVI